MRISDWSSDVCSSDLEEYRLDRGLPRPQAQRVIAQRRIVGVEDERGTAIGMAGKIGMEHGLTTLPPMLLRGMARHCRSQVTASLHHASDSDVKGECEDRKSVVEGKRVSVRVDPGGRR